MQEDIISAISKHRRPVMGYAICLVLFVHIFFLDIMTDSWGVWWNKVRQMGSSGVDLFLIVSAFGLCFSMKKQPSARAFYAKRIGRILPMLLAGFLIAYVPELVDDIAGRLRVPTIIGNTFFAFRHYFYSLWFLYLLFFLYILFPLIWDYLEGAAEGQPRLRRCRLLFVATTCMCAMMILSIYDLGITDMYSTILISIFRVPVFLTGIFLVYQLPVATRIYRSHWVFVVSLTVSLLTSMYLPAIQYVAFGFMALSGIKYLVWVFERVGWLRAVFSFFGRFTLEIYVMHMYVFSHITLYLPPRSLTTLAVAVALSLLSAILLHYLLHYGARLVGRWRQGRSRE